MHTVTRRNPNGVPVAAPASVRCRTGIGAALLALRWTARGYAVDLARDPHDTASSIRSRPAAAVPTPR